MATMNMMKLAMKPIAKETLRSIWIPNDDRRNSVQIGLQSSVPFSSKKNPLEHSNMLFNEVWFAWLSAVVSRSDADAVAWSLEKPDVLLSRSNG